MHAGVSQGRSQQAFGMSRMGRHADNAMTPVADNTCVSRVVPCHAVH